MIAQNVKIYPGQILRKTLSSIMYIAASVYLPHQAMMITESWLISRCADSSYPQSCRFWTR